MGRREFLREAALAATVGLAGCAMLDGGSDDGNAEYEPTTRDHLAVAVGNLNTVALAISQYQRAGDPGETTFDAQQPRERLTIAREALDAADQDAESSAGESDVTAVERYADAIARTVDAVVGLDQAGSELEDVEDALNSAEVDTDRAGEAADDAATASGQAVSAHERAATALAEADGNRLGPLDAEYEAMTDGLETLAGYVVGVDGLAVGYSDQVTGVSHLQTANDDVDGKAFNAASESFTAAGEAFDTAEAQFDGSVADAADSLVSDLELGSDRSRSLSRLAAGYVSLLLGRDHLTDAERSIGEEGYDDAQTALTNASGETETAMSRFEKGDDVIDEFTDEFEQARNRGAAIAALVDGYRRLLSARDYIADAESRIDADEPEAARASLNEASTESTAADEQFATGQQAGADLAGEAFETARSRAVAMRKLATGYVELLDGRDHLEDGESAFLDEDYDEAESAFETAAETSQTAADTFDEGATATGEGTFDQEFARATDRAAALDALSSGYAKMVSGRQRAQDGRDALDDREYSTAADDLEVAADTLADAEMTVADGQKGADGTFETQFDRARCQVQTLESAVSHFETAAEAGEDGRLQKANEGLASGEDDLKQVDDC